MHRVSKTCSLLRDTSNALFITGRSSSPPHKMMQMQQRNWAISSEWGSCDSCPSSHPPLRLQLPSLVPATVKDIRSGDWSQSRCSNLEYKDSTDCISHDFTIWVRQCCATDIRRFVRRELRMICRIGKACSLTAQGCSGVVV